MWVTQNADAHREWWVISMPPYQGGQGVPYATPLCNTIATFFLWYHWLFENWVQFILIISPPFLQQPLDPAPVLSSQGRQQLNWPDSTIPGQITEVSSCISFLPKNFSPPSPLVKAPPLGKGEVCLEVEERSHVSAHSRRHSHFPFLSSKTWNAFPPPHPHFPLLFFSWPAFSPSALVSNNSSSSFNEPHSTSPRWPWWSLCRKLSFLPSPQSF